MTLWQVFESVAARCAERVAVEVQRQTAVETWTYRQLHAAAETYSGRLAAAGLAAGDRCAILADGDARWCAAYFGILRLGAVAVPLDTNCSGSQLELVVRDLRPRVLLANARLAPVAHEAVAGLGIVVSLLDGTRAGPPAKPCHETAATATAVILYTAGTTSEPRGVMLSHASLLAVRDAALAVVSVREPDAVLGVLPLFDAFAHLANLLLPLLVGARVVFLETLTSSELERAFRERRITILAGAPELFELLHDRLLGRVASGGWAGRATFRALAVLSVQARRAGINIGPRLFRRVHSLLGGQMRLFVTGGAFFDPAIARDFDALGLTTHHAYVLTETSGAATLSTADEALLGTVGCALPGHELRILPSETSDFAGEIAIRGPGVMQGYYNRSLATHEVMRDGWFLTGDLGRLDAKGRLTITGRRKEVLVLASGKQVCAEAIEAQYLQSPFIEEICVFNLTNADEPMTEQLHAAVVPAMDILRERRIANVGDLIRFEIEGHSVHLPVDERVLGYDVWFEPLPRTAAGKLQRAEIARRVQQKHLAAARRHGAPTEITHWNGDPHATAIAAVIRRHARRALVLPDSNLEIDLAFDSLERVELIAILEARFGVRLSSADTAGILTVAQLIEAIRRGPPAARASAVESSWAALLHDLPPASDPLVAPLLEERRFVPAMCFVALRALRLFLPRVEASGVEHLPAEGPYILAPNHQSYLDPLFVCSVLPFAVLRRLFFVGATEYFETRLTAWLARQLNLVPVDPDANLVPALKAGAFGLTHGRILLLFPEGERSIDGRVKRFKKGAAILSRHVDVPIVPVAIHGVFELWPRNRKFNWRVLRPWSRHIIHVAFGRPLRIPSDASDADGTAALRDVVHSTWEAIDRSTSRAERASSGRLFTP